MGAPLIPEEQFISLWKQYGSAELIADTLGIKVRGVHSRRRFIEKKHGIRLQAIDRRGGAGPLITDDRVEIKLTVEDGIILVGGDSHYWPGSVPTLHRAFVRLCKELKPVAAINNGDSFDGARVSRFPDIGHESKPSVAEEIENLKDRLDEIVKASPSAAHPWNLGNHCMRFETRLAAAVPEYQKVHGFHLKDHFPSWLPSWFVTVNEGEESHTEIRHRENGGMHAVYNNVLKSGINMVTGHDHRADSVRYDDRRGYRWGVRTGMMADSARDKQFVNYLEGRKPNWQAAFTVLTYKGGRLMAPEHCWRIDEDTVEWRREILNV